MRSKFPSVLVSIFLKSLDIPSVYVPVMEENDVSAHFKLNMGCQENSL